MYGQAPPIRAKAMERGKEILGMPEEIVSSLTKKSSLEMLENYVTNKRHYHLCVQWLCGSYKPRLSTNFKLNFNND